VPAGSIAREGKIARTILSETHLCTFNGEKCSLLHLRLQVNPQLVYTLYRDLAQLSQISQERFGKHLLRPLAISIRQETQYILELEVVTELLSNGHLQEYLSVFSELALKESFRFQIATGVAEALHALAKLGLVLGVGGVRTDNVLVTENQEACV
jgi:hypothetical protein